MSSATYHALIASILGGVCLFAITEATKATDSIPLIGILVYFFAILTLIVINRFKKVKSTENTKAASHKTVEALLSGVFLAIASLFYLFSIKKGMSPGNATTIYQMGFLLTSVAAIFLFKEKITFRRVFGWCLAGAAVVLMQL